MKYQLSSFSIAHSRMKIYHFFSQRNTQIFQRAYKKHIPHRKRYVLFSSYYILITEYRYILR